MTAQFPASPTPRFLAIDPGKRGGLVLMETGRILKTTEMPATPLDVYNWVSGATLVNGWWDVDLRVVIEDVHAFPTDSRKGAFEFGRGLGVLQAVLSIVVVNEPVLVLPQAWQRGLGLRKKKPGEKSPAWKKYLLEVAQELYPDVEVTLEIADAILIGEYACLLAEKGELT